LSREREVDSKPDRSRKILGLFRSRGTLIVALFGALLVVALVLQLAESAWNTVSPSEEPVLPPPSSDPDDIRAFIEGARPEIDVEDRTVDIQMSHGRTRIRFDDDEDAEMESFLACLKKGDEEVMARMLEETDEIPSGRFARLHLEARIHEEFKTAADVCVSEVFEIPQIPEIPEIPEFD
jgi:hypothetical protein